MMGVVRKTGVQVLKEVDPARAATCKDIEPLGVLIVE
jgi:hypothetical protein